MLASSFIYLPECIANFDDFQVYIEPLNRPENFSLCEPRLVKTIFYRIPELLDHHQKFCKKIQHCCNNWNTDTKIGELFTDAVSVSIETNIFLV